jgi:hypothetical protein
MKKETLILLRIGSIAFLLLNQPSFAVDIHFQPEQVKVIPERTFIPSGFDNNDNVQIVVSGNLPNTRFIVHFLT